MKLSEQIAEEMIDDSEWLEELAQTLDVESKTKGACLDDVKNFHGGIMTALLVIEQCESVDQIIISLEALKTVLEAKIANFTPVDPVVVRRYKSPDQP